MARIGDYLNKTQTFGDEVREILKEDQKVNDIPIYFKIFFREICKRNKTNIITLNYYRDGGVYVLLSENRKDE